MGVFKIGSCKVFVQAGLTLILLTSASQEARIIDVYHWCPVRVKKD
jgi:hypothetical protein